MKSFFESKNGNIVHIAVYDCFSGEVKVMRVGDEGIVIKIRNVCSCYSCQRPMRRGKTLFIRYDLVAECDGKHFFEGKEYDIYAPGRA